MPNQSVDRTAHPWRVRRPVTLDVRMKSIITGIVIATTMGCATQHSPYPIHISHPGYQDVDIRCAGPQDPIEIRSRYCYGDAPLVTTNGNVILFLTDGEIQMIGWDNEGLKRGGQVQVSAALLSGRTTVARDWWNQLENADKRFGVAVSQKQ
jgi:hypothetical protein